MFTGALSSQHTPATPSKFDVKKLFQKPSSAPALSPTASESSASVALPSSQPSPLPQPPPQSSHLQPQPSQLGVHSYPTFVPGRGLLPQQKGTQFRPGSPPRSSHYPWQTNGMNERTNSYPDESGSGPGPGMLADMLSPFIEPPLIELPAGLPPPVPVQSWLGYWYPPQYPGVPPDANILIVPGWFIPNLVPQPHQPQGPPGGPRPGMPLSPQNPSPQLHPLGTPSLTSVIPSNAYPPHSSPSTHAQTASLSSVSSLPPSPSISSSGNIMDDLDTNGSTFAPRKANPVKLTTMNGMEASLEALKKHLASAPFPTVPSSPARKVAVVRMETPKAEEKRLAEEREKERQKSEAAEKRVRKEVDFYGTQGQPVGQPLPSPLATARIIEDLGSASYPEDIKSPQVELDVNAKRFTAVCKGQIDSLLPLDAMDLEPSAQSFPMSRGGSGRRSSSAQMPPPSSTTARQGVRLGISGLNRSGTNPFNMGHFGTANAKMSSEERFASPNPSRSTSMSGGSSGMPFNGPTALVRSSSQGGPGGTAVSNKRTRSWRGVDRADVSRASGPSGSSYNSSMSQQGGLPLKPVAPLELSANRWQPAGASIVKNPQQQEQDSPEVVDRKVRALLNKLTMERFDSISDKIIAWVNKSEKEKNGRTLIQVIRLVFEKATDEATWSEIYARLCRKIMEQISPKVQDDGIKNNEGKPIAGGQLFRKYLLNRCQEDFERGWVVKEATATAAAMKATEDQAAKVATEKNANNESALYSDEYYAAQKAKRQGLGLIKFIGELFKLQMLAGRIMHQCIKKLLGNVGNLEEEEIESLCKLLITVGQSLDTPKAHARMDVYFTRMKELCKSGNVNSRMQFMLQDIIELRERKWVPRNAVAAPTTIAAVHEAAAKEKEKEAYARTLSMSRGGSRRGGDRGDHTQVGPDGWAVAGSSAPRPPPKAGDLTHFGKITKTTSLSMSFGPNSVFAGKKDSKSREPTMTRTSSQNMFSKLMENPELAAEAATSKSSRQPSRKASVDFRSAGAPEASLQRRKLNLLPRSIPKPDDKADSTPAASEAGNSDDEDSEAPSVPSMSEEEAKTRIKEDSKEFFNIRNLDEAEVYFTKLPSEHRHLLVEKLVTFAIESKESDAQLVADFFSRAVSNNLCSPQSFEDGFSSTAEILDDIAIDAPKAFNLMAIMMKGAGLDRDEDRCTRLASKSMDSDKLLALLS